MANTNKDTFLSYAETQLTRSGYTEYNISLCLSFLRYLYDNASYFSDLQSVIVNEADGELDDVEESEAVVPVVPVLDLKNLMRESRVAQEWARDFTLYTVSIVRLVELLEDNPDLTQIVCQAVIYYFATYGSDVKGVEARTVKVIKQQAQRTRQIDVLKGNYIRVKDLARAIEYWNIEGMAGL